jgi:glycosyltransferase involved in cell wall biosynthesis
MMIKKPIKVGLLTHPFSRWGGGVDFIRHMLSFLDEEQKHNAEISKILVLSKEDYLVKFKHFIYPFRQLFKQLAKKDRLRWNKRPGFSRDYLENTFLKFHSTTEIKISGSSLRSQLSAAKLAKADIIMPCLEIPPISYKLPWIGYLGDFQHCEMPYFFTDKEIRRRNLEFKMMLNTAKHIIVYSKSVVMNASKFYPGHSAKLHPLPFCPCPQDEWLLSTLDVRDSYQINQNYFLICNQFWQHKDHATAFRAFAQYYASGGDALLVCTGETADYRYPEHFSNMLTLISQLGVKDRIRVLGHISKEHQISLMKNAQAVIQPTLYEGGPGGGSTYDAIALGVRVIVSNIPINLEVNCGDVTFFHAGDSIDLAKAMGSKKFKELGERESNQILFERGLIQRRIAGKFLKDVLYEALNE